MDRIIIIMGTRPEIIKLSPVIKELDKRNIENEIIFIDQHYDYNLSRNFFKELKLGKPKFHLQIGKGTQAEQIGKALIATEKILIQNKPEIVLIQGDTNSSLAGALAAVKSHLKIAHIEAGLRSYDYRMPEEYNRRMIDHISNYLFAPTKKSEEILKNENVWGEIFVTGNTSLDSCLQNYKNADIESNITKDIPFKNYILITAHRAENVDTKKSLKNLVEIFSNLPIPVVFPIHPRTEKKLKMFNFFEKLDRSENIMIIPPIGYFDLLKLMYNSKFIITDSGGIQEEATAPVIRKFTFVIRRTTDRPESCDIGFAKLVGTEPNYVLNEIREFINNPKELPRKSPFGDGNASSKILTILEERLNLN